MDRRRANNEANVSSAGGLKGTSVRASAGSEEIVAFAGISNDAPAPSARSPKTAWSPWSNMSSWIGGRGRDLEVVRKDGHSREAAFILALQCTTLAF